jgi:hypothetical protein
VVQCLRRGLLSHLCHGAGAGHRPGAGKAVEDHRQAEVVVAVAVRDVDSDEAALVQRDPGGERGGLVDGHEGVDEHSIVNAEDQRRRGGVPGRRIADVRRRGGERLLGRATNTS